MKKQAPGGPQVTAPGAPDRCCPMQAPEPGGERQKVFMVPRSSGGWGGRFHVTGDPPSIDPGEERS